MAAFPFRFLNGTESESASGHLEPCDALERRIRDVVPNEVAVKETVSTPWLVPSKKYSGIFTIQKGSEKI